MLNHFFSTIILKAKDTIASTRKGGLIKKLFEHFFNFKKSRFAKDVAIVAGGTATAQLITIAFSPIITRLYPAFPEIYTYEPIKPQ